MDSRWNAYDATSYYSFGDVSSEVEAFSLAANLAELMLIGGLAQGQSIPSDWNEATHLAYADALGLQDAVLERSPEAPDAQSARYRLGRLPSQLEVCLGVSIPHIGQSHLRQSPLRRLREAPPAQPEALEDWVTRRYGRLVPSAAPLSLNSLYERFFAAAPEAVFLHFAISHERAHGAGGWQPPFDNAAGVCRAMLSAARNAAFTARQKNAQQIMRCRPSAAAMLLTMAVNGEAEPVVPGREFIDDTAAILADRAACLLDWVHRINCDGTAGMTIVSPEQERHSGWSPFALDRLYMLPRPVGHERADVNDDTLVSAAIAGACSSVLLGAIAPNAVQSGAPNPADAIRSLICSVFLVHGVDARFYPSEVFATFDIGRHAARRLIGNRFKAG